MFKFSMEVRDNNNDCPKKGKKILYGSIREVSSFYFDQTLFKNKNYWIERFEESLNKQKS